MKVQFLLFAAVMDGFRHSPEGIAVTTTTTTVGFVDSCAGHID